MSVDLIFRVTAPDNCFTPLEKLVLRYAVAMTETPVEVHDALFEELKQHFNNQQLVELTSAIAWENYRSRYNHAFDIEAEGFSDGAFCPVAVHAASGRIAANAEA